jgi:hypothetical protein
MKLAPPPQVALKKLTAADQPKQAASGAMIAGMHRTLPADALKRGRWTKLASGESVWRLGVKSQDASGIRIHFRNFAAAGGSVWIYSTLGMKPEVAGPYSGGGPNRDGDFWSDVVFADTVVMEYKPARGVRASGTPPFRIPEISHLW